MNQIPFSPEFPEGAQYAKLSSDGSFIQGFYKEVEEKYNDGTKAIRLYHKSSLPVWQPSLYTLNGLLEQPFEIVSIKAN